MKYPNDLTLTPTPFRHMTSHDHLTFHQHADSHDGILQDPAPSCCRTRLEHEQQSLHDGGRDGQSIFPVDFTHETLQCGAEQRLQIS